MELDMYLLKTKKVDGYTIKDFYLADDYVCWKDRGSYCSFKDWCGIDEEDIDMDKINKLMPLMKTTYRDWDIEKVYPHTSCIEEIGYWQKANAIHFWFVSNIQNGVDDCGSYAVKKEDLVELLFVCKDVMRDCIFTYGSVENGYMIKDGKITALYEPDKRIVLNTADMETLLPTLSGSFFGCTGYNEWYLESVEDTIEILEKVLRETDFETEQVYYCSSW